MPHTIRVKGGIVRKTFAMRGVFVKNPNNMTIQRIIKHGNSLAVVIPANICRELELKLGDHLELQLQKQVKAPDCPANFCIILWQIKLEKSRSIK